MLWYKVIKSKYDLHPNKWDSKIAERTKFRNPWKLFLSTMISSMWCASRWAMVIRIDFGRMFGEEMRPSVIGFQPYTERVHVLIVKFQISRFLNMNIQ